MEGKGRLLGWIAIGLGAIALVVALAGHGGGPRGMGYNWRAPVAPQPPANVAPGDQPGAQQMPGWPGPRQGFGPQLRRGSQGDQGFQNGPRGFFGFGNQRGMGPFGLFLWPFMLVRGLSRLLLVGLLIFLAVKFLRRRNNGGSWRGPDAPGGPGGPARPEQPGPEQPPYTGETQNL